MTVLCESSMQVRSQYAYAVKWQLDPLQTEATYSLYPLFMPAPPCFHLLTAIHKYLKQRSVFHFSVCCELKMTHQRYRDNPRSAGSNENSLLSRITQWHGAGES